MEKKRVYINGILLDGTEEMEPVTGKAVVTEGSRIVSIEDQQSSYEGYEIIDLNDMYLMPGLINMHVHLAGNGKPQKKQRDNEALVNLLFSNPISAYAAYRMVRSYAETELMSGVTTIRTVGGLRNLDARVKNEILAGKIKGPRMIISNEGISVPGGHMAGSVAVAVKSAEEAREMVRRSKAQGSDFIKLMITGGVLDAREKGVPGELKMPPEIVRAACEEAHRNGMIAAAHVESSEGVIVALENGVDSIEHGAKMTDEMVRLFKEKQAFLTTTISPTLPYALFDRSVTGASEVEQYNGQVVFEGVLECAKGALANGIPVALGNDVGCPWISQYDFWRELVYFHKYIGVSNRFALYTATLRNARLAGIGEETGSIEEGKAADMIVCAKNPLEDLRVLKNLEMVIARGELIVHPQVRRNPLLEQELNPFMELNEDDSAASDV